MQRRAWGVLAIKSVEDGADARVIRGVASTPVTDRAGDIIEPSGAKFTLPLPLLWQHRSDSPIGHVTEAVVTPEGIAITARIAKTDEPGELKNLLDKAYQAIKLGLVRGLSIGFKALEWSDIAGTWGQRFTSWEWLELSAVTIPANADATIQAVKSFDVEQRAASGREPFDVASPRARGPVRIIDNPRRGTTMKTTAERISAFEATRAAKAARLQELSNAAGEAGRTKDEAEQEEFDTIRDELRSIDRELVDLRDLEKLLVATAKPADGARSVEGAAAARATQVVVKAEPKLEAGIRFARVVKCLGVAHRKHRDIEVVARQMFPDDALVQKAAVAAGATVAGNWAEGLVGDETSVFADFVEFLRPQTILGRFGSGGIPSLRRVPFRTPLIGQTVGGDGYWVGEGKPKPLTKFGFERRTLEPLKVANIAVITDELLMASAPSADTMVRDQLAAALRERLDIDFIDPAKAAVAGISPASITNGIAPIPSSGTDADAVRADIGALVETFVDANNPPEVGVFIMQSVIALQLGLMRTALSSKEFPEMSLRGGSLEGLPVITSQYVPDGIVVLVNASDIYLGDEGGIGVDASREASLEMDSAPAGQDALTGTGASLVSMFQTNSVAFRAERTINWDRRRDEAVAMLNGVAWGGVSS